MTKLLSQKFQWQGFSTFYLENNFAHVSSDFTNIKLTHYPCHRLDHKKKNSLMLKKGDIHLFPGS